MIISRQKYERELKEAYEKGRYEAEERCYRERSIERVWEELRRISNKVSKLEREKENEPAEHLPVIDPGVCI